MAEEADLYTKDGTTDFRGNPAIKKKTGTWKACPYILGDYSRPSDVKPFLLSSSSFGHYDHLDILISLQEMSAVKDWRTMESTPI